MTRRTRGLAHLAMVLVLGGLAGCEDPPAPAPQSAPAPTLSVHASATLAAAGASEQSRATAARAQELAQRILIVDGHVDLPHRLHEGRDDAGRITEDPSLRTKKGDFDFVRAREGGLDAPFMSIYVPSEHQKTGGAKALADQLIDMVEQLIEQAPDKFAPAHSVADVLRSFSEKKVALPMGIENGAALEGKLENVAHFHRRGVRYITLAHAKDNDLSDSSYDTAHTNGGLSELGKQVVAEMNRVGIMVDVSHISDEAFDDVIEVTKVPVIASHSSVRHFTPGFERNMSDAMIKKLAHNGGVIMINYGSGFLDKDINQKSGEMWKARLAFIADNHLDPKDPKVELFVDRYKKEHSIGYATVETVADHIEHVIKLVGIDHVGLGSDFDGVGDSLPTGLKDVAHIPNLIRVLLERGYDEKQIEKICSSNVLRVWKEVERFAHGQLARGKGAPAKATP